MAHLARKERDRLRVTSSRRRTSSPSSQSASGSTTVPTLALVKEKRVVDRLEGRAARRGSSACSSRTSTPPKNRRAPPAYTRSRPSERRSMRRALTAARGCSSIARRAIAAGAATNATTKLEANLSGANEGAPASNSGKTEIRLTPATGRVCWETKIAKIDGKPNASHIHKGAPWCLRQRRRAARCELQAPGLHHRVEGADQGDHQSTRCLLRERAQREASGRRNARAADSGDLSPPRRRGPVDPRRRRSVPLSLLEAPDHGKAELGRAGAVDDAVVEGDRDRRRSAAPRSRRHGRPVARPHARD